MRMIILAAGQGSRLRPLTDDRPKCLVPLAGKSLLDWQLESAREAGITEITVVGGYCAHQLRRPDIHLVENRAFDSTNMVVSLFCAEPWFGEGFILSYGDIVYQSEILRAMMACPQPAAAAVDQQWQSYWQQRFTDPLSDAESLRIDPSGQITSIGQPVEKIEQIQAQFIGLMKFQGGGIDQLRHAYQLASQADQAGQRPFGQSRTLAQLFMTDLLQGMIDLGHPLAAVPIQRGWFEIDSPQDLKIAQAHWAPPPNSNELVA